jgi:hypothetical protein
MQALTLRMSGRCATYLEPKDAAPLLFHLKALTDPAEFWPLIEREIRARNFFLYCESPAAQASDWVKRKREAVEAARRERPIRIGEVRVDRSEIDATQLDDFLSKIRVFLPSVPGITKSSTLSSRRWKRPVSVCSVP